MLIWPSEEVEEAMQAGRIVIHPAYMPLQKSCTISKDRHSGKVSNHRRRMMPKTECEQLGSIQSFSVVRYKLVPLRTYLCLVL
jgi:hypothetical protein